MLTGGGKKMVSQKVKNKNTDGCSNFYFLEYIYKIGNFIKTIPTTLHFRDNTHIHFF